MSWKEGILKPEFKFKTWDNTLKGEWEKKPYVKPKKQTEIMEEYAMRNKRFTAKAMEKDLGLHMKPKRIRTWLEAHPKISKQRRYIGSGGQSSIEYVWEG
jgi:hypothetical protein